MHVYKTLCTNFKPVKNLQDILPFIHNVTTEQDVFENESSLSLETLLHKRFPERYVRDAVATTIYCTVMEELEENDR